MLVGFLAFFAIDRVLAFTESRERSKQYCRNRFSETCRFMYDILTIYIIIV